MDPRTDAAAPRRERDLLDPRGWLAAALVVLVPLAATGLWQAWHYRPTAHQAWGGVGATQTWEDIYTLQTDPPLRPPAHGAGWVSDAHRGLAITFVVVGAVFVACLLRWAWRKRGGDAVAVAAAVVAVGAAALAPAAGRGLLFDQLALWAVTVGTRHGGIWGAAFDDSIRFVLIDGVEVSQGTYRGDVIEHAIVVPALLLGAALAVSVRLRRR